LVKDASGNVGIGASSVISKLQVVADQASYVNDLAQLTVTGTNTNQRLLLGYNTSTDKAFIQATKVGTAYQDLVLQSGGGNLLVGTTTAWAKLSVQSAGTTSATQVVSFRDSSANEKLVVRSDGYTYAPYWYANTTGSGANVFVDTNGGLVRSTSSLKYKKNVVNTTHGLTELLMLRAVTYEGKSESDEGKTFGGLIAEEVHEAGLTEFVQYAEDGSPDALAYGNMVSLCIKAIQEQQALITALTARITALENK